MNTSGADLRSNLAEAERAMFEGIGLIRSNDPARARSVFFRARDLYGALAAADRPELQLLAKDRRIHSRIDRILKALEGGPKVEYYDVLDERGAPTGVREVSTLAHLKGTRHASLVVLFFNRAGEILLQTRSPGLAVFPGKQTFAATGHVAAGHTSREAAREEIIEEIAAPIPEDDARNVTDRFPAGITTREDNRRWIHFTPREENLIQIGGENEYDSALYLAEFVYWDDDERELLESKARTLSEQVNGAGIARILGDIDSSANTLSFFTFDPSLTAKAAELAEALSAKTQIPRGMITDNVEKRSLYVYHLKPDEEPLLDAIMQLKGGGAAIDPSMTVGFEWKPFDDVVREFMASPGRYTDGFVPFLSNHAIVQRIQEKSRL